MSNEEIEKEKVAETLDSACKAVCKHCECGMPVYLCNITKSWRHREGCTGGNDFSCRAAAIRAMMEEK